MVSRKTSSSAPRTSSLPPATTPEERENQLIAAAVDLAEQQIRSGTASAQVISHFLKLGSSREKLEQERLRNENSLLVTKQEVLESEKRTEALMVDALKAMKAYSGNSSEEDEYGNDEYPN